MKITKRKWKGIPPVYFYRDEGSGKLLTGDDNLRDYTDELFGGEDVRLVFERSLKDRLLKTQDKNKAKEGQGKAGDKTGKNEIAWFVEELCRGSDIEKCIDKIKRLSYREIREKCDEALSGYGKNFTAPGGSKTLREALLDLAKGKDMQKALAVAELENIQKALVKMKDSGADRVRYSIKGNKMPLKINNGSIEVNNDRAAWLLELLKPVSPSPFKPHKPSGKQPSGHADYYPVLTEMEKIFSFEELSREIHKEIAKCGGNPREIAKAAEETLKKHYKALWDKYPERHRDMKYYFQAVQEYFRKNFPIRTKQKGAYLRQELLKNSANVSRLLEPEHIAGAVRRRLINQSTQMNILYGKLYEYCVRSDNKLPVNSETLQKIQVLEAVKKQIMTAILWATARLSYFYNHQESKEVKGKDILSDKQIVKNYRENYLIDKSKYNDEDVRECKEKLQDFFPLGDVQEYLRKNKNKDEKNKDLEWFNGSAEEFLDDRRLCNKLLLDCVKCISKLRVNIYHYKNMGLTQALKKAADQAEIKESDVLPNFFPWDVLNIKKAFAERLRSMNLPLYYSGDMLTRVFTKSGFTFSLYSPNEQMTPSFRKVYERGRNLGLKWFKQPDGTGDDVFISDDAFSSRVDGTDDNARRAVRNLLQLIYKHHFLPEVRKNEAIVTCKIPKVIGRNKALAAERNVSERSKSGETRFGGTGGRYEKYGSGTKRPKAFGYSIIEEIYHDGMKLSELLKQLQRIISDTEKEYQESAKGGREPERDDRESAKGKTDYAQRFILDIFAEAFDSFMEENYGKEYTEIMSPSKNEEEAKKWAKRIEDGDIKINLATTFCAYEDNIGKGERIVTDGKESEDNTKSEAEADKTENCNSEGDNTEEKVQENTVCGSLTSENGNPVFQYGQNKNKIKIEKYLLILYPIMRLLDERELGELQQQMARLRASVSNWQGETGLGEDVEIIERIEELTEFVKLTEPAHKYSDEKWKERIKKEFEPFVEGTMQDYGDFYLQNDKESSLVLRRNMVRLLRSGMLKVYRHVQCGLKPVTKNDYDIYCGKYMDVKDQEGRVISTPEEAQKALRQLHDKYAASPSEFSEADRELYGKILNRLEKYNQASKNLSFSTLYEICAINMEMLSRWIGFAQDWERDMYFLLMAWVNQGKLKNIKEEDVVKIFEKGKVIGNLMGTLKGENMDMFKSVYRLGGDKSSGKKQNNDCFLEVRNKVDHLDLMKIDTWTCGTNNGLSIIEKYINKMRILLSYDQKRMNVVTKTMQKVFEEHKTQVKFAVKKGGEMKFESVKPVNITHLKKYGEHNKRIDIPSHGETFIKILDHLLTYPK